MGLLPGQARGDTSVPVGSLTFQCNICGQICQTRLAEMHREVASCPGCRSTPRWRGVIRALSLELFGESLAIPDFPERRELHGIGMSDWDGYALPLSGKLSYTNTYLHQEPRLDISVGAAHLEGALDFVISSEVFEHVNPPISVAFENTRKLLKPGGVMILTVPYANEGEHREHYPELYDYEVLERGGRQVLRNVTREGSEQVFEDLVWHGGPGFTLELRVFSEGSLVGYLRNAGFGPIKIYSDPDFDHGVYWPEPWSLPVAARTL